MSSLLKRCEALVLDKYDRANGAPGGHLSGDPGDSAQKIVLSDGRIGWDDRTYVHFFARGSSNKVAWRVATREVAPILVRHRDDNGRAYSGFPFLSPELFFVANETVGETEGKFDHGQKRTVLTGNPWLERFAVRQAQGHILRVYCGDWPYNSSLARSELFLESAARDLAILGYQVEANETTREIAGRIRSPLRRRRLSLGEGLCVKAFIAPGTGGRRYQFCLTL